MPSLTSYAKALQELYTVNLRRPAKFGLQNSLRLYEALHRPLDALPVIHVAGTNGKGSVSLKVSNVLRAAGIRTGLFISPHISSYRERIQVNGEYISEEEMCSELEHILDICESNAIPATFFELTTALAFQHYRKSQCEAVVLEVGLGGRSDSTNVIQPLVSVITSIGMDHCKILGDTIEQIAREKAGIMKSGVPVLIGPGCPIQVMREEANRSEARLVPVHDYLSSEERLFDDRSGRSSDIDNLNSDIAYAVVKLLCDEKFLPGNILGSRIKAALNRVEVWKAIDIRPPCRFELHRITHEHGTTEVVFDIAHNVDAIEALVKKLKSRYQHNKFRVVLGMSADKDVRECLKALLTLTPPAMIHCTEANHPRATKKEELRQLIDAMVEPYIPPNDAGVKDTVAAALQLSAANREVVLICGSAFIMADARAAVGIVEPRDGDILFELLGSQNSDMQESFVDTRTQKI